MAVGTPRDRIHSFSDLPTQTLLSTEHQNLIKIASTEPGKSSNTNSMCCRLMRWLLGSWYTQRQLVPHVLRTLHTWRDSPSRKPKARVSIHARPPRAALRDELAKLSRNRGTTSRHSSSRYSGVLFNLRVSIDTLRITPSKV